MSDSSALDMAVVTALTADAALRTLLPDGIWWNVAPQGRTKFVAIALETAVDTYEENRAAFEQPVYRIEAVAKESTTATVDAAADRIRVLMGGTLTATGYHLMRVERRERVKHGEHDPGDAAVVWQYHGGLYEIQAEPV